MRAPKVIETFEPNQEFIWVTHLPDFSIEKFEIETIDHDKNGDILIKLVDSNIYGNTIRAKKNSNGNKEFWLMKKSYHLTESEAAHRLREHYRALHSEHTVATRVLSDAKDKEITEANIEKYVINYPEMTI